MKPMTEPSETDTPEIRRISKAEINELPMIAWEGEVKILETVGGGLGDDTGAVEFAAHYSSDSGTGVHHERSRFRRHEMPP